MSKRGNKILNYIAMACATLAIITFCIDKDWYAALWAFIALAWMVNSHLIEDSYYDFKERFDKLTGDYFHAITMHVKEVKELKDEIESLKKGK